MKKILGYSSVVAAILVLTAGSILLYRLTQFRAAVERLKSQGQPVSFADLNQPETEVGRAAQLVFNRLQTQLTAFETEMYVDKEVMDRPVADEMIARFNELSNAYPSVYPLLDQLAEKSQISTELEGNSQENLEVLLDRVQKLRSCARVLAWKMRIQSAQQQPDEAIATGLQIMRIGHLADQHPTVVSLLVGNAIRGIAISRIHDVVVNNPVSGEALEQLNAELERQGAANAYLESLKTERPIGIELLSDMGLFQMAYSGTGYLEIVEDEIRNADKESFQQDFVVESGYSPWINGALGHSLLPAFQATRRSVARIRSQLRALRIISALQSHPEATSKTITPEYLVEIGVPESMTVDTMNGEPMKVKFEDGHWIVYSVGPDLKDNGGSANLSEDFTLGAVSKK